MGGSPFGEQFGPYLVYERLGIGGMATVHRAETTGIAGFRRPVALKRMLPHIASNDDFVRSFVREARLASHLHHTNVAQTYDLGKVDDIYFIAMELVVGRTLRDILRHAIHAKLRVPIPITLNILNQVCDALDYAHNLCDDSGKPFGIIHRDVSPSNVIVSESGVVKLIDFGIAKASAAGMQTLSGTIKGKFGYMAPEYLAGKIDARADLFAVGIIAHELLTGRPLFQGRDDMDTLYRVRSMPLHPPSRDNPEIPHEIDAIVMTALERDPEARWQRAAAMRMALTTEVKRLGLTMFDQEVVQWVDAIFAAHAFEADSKPGATSVLPRDMPTGTSPSVMIERVDDVDDDVDDDVVDDVVDAPRAQAPPTQRDDEPPEGLPPEDLRRTLLRDGAPHAVQARRSARMSEAMPLALPLPAPRAATDLPAGPTRSLRPSQQHTAPEPAPVASPTLSLRPSQRHAAPEPPLAALPSARQALSGARTRPNLQRTLHVDASDVVAEVEVESRLGNLTIFVLLVLTAAAAGAVVYFGLPYIQ